MKIVISPAKSLDFETPLPTKLYSEYGFQKQSLAIDKDLKKKKLPIPEPEPITETAAEDEHPSPFPTGVEA